ncbi:MAG TPA: hypothetical protein ENN68_01165 [Methanomicrobia archaeon]|nr:hypothetical protein [Methanomicrobia archaeon]
MVFEYPDQDVTKGDLNECVRALVNELLRSAQPDGSLHVVDLDIGLIVYPDDLLANSPDEILEDLVYPVYREDLTSNASLLAEVHLKETERGLMSKMFVRFQITEPAEVEIIKAEIYETEFLVSDIVTVKRRRECERLLEERAARLSTAFKTAIMQLMAEKRVAN